jgi:hypothetical protein
MSLRWETRSEQFTKQNWGRLDVSQYTFSNILENIDIISENRCVDFQSVFLPIGDDGKHYTKAIQKA